MRVHAPPEKAFSKKVFSSPENFVVQKVSVEFVFVKTSSSLSSSKRRRVVEVCVGGWLAVAAWLETVWSRLVVLGGAITSPDNAGSVLAASRR